MRDEEALAGPWQAVMSKLEGCHQVVVDPNNPGVHPIDLVVSIVRGSKLPVDGVIPLGADVWDEACEFGEMVDTETVAGMWARAQAMAAGLNAAAKETGR